MGELTITLGDAIQAMIFIGGLLVAYFKQKDIMEENHAALVSQMQKISADNAEAHSDRKAEIERAKTEATAALTDTEKILRAEITDVDKRVILLEAAAP